MTTELEKQFFGTFGFEPKTNREYGHITAIYNEAGEEIKFYPRITDRILLELICVLNENTTLDETYYQGASTVKELKKLVLKDLIKTKENFDTKHQVQAIFEGKDENKINQ